MSGALITLIIELIKIAPDLVSKLMANGQRTGEFTPEEAAAFKARMEQAWLSPHWQPRPPGDV